MNLKKMTAMLMAGVMSAGLLTGCSLNMKPLNEPTESAESTGYQGEITMLFSTKDEFLSYLDQSAKSYASANGCTLNTIDCGESNETQVEYVKAAVEEGADVIMIVIADNSGAQELIDAAGDVPIVFVNRKPADESVLDDKHVYIGSNESDAGTYQGVTLAQELEKEGKNSVNYVMLKGNEGHDSTEKRTEGVLTALKNAGITATAVAEENCNFDRTTAAETMGKLLDDGLDMSKVDCIISNNDAMALGAIDACAQKNVDLTDKLIVGVDGINDGLKAVSEGKMLATVHQNATAQAAASVQAAINLAGGKNATDGLEYAASEDNASIVWIPFELITEDNVASFY